MKVRPLHDFILIELEPPRKKVGSIIIPDPERAPLRIGKVLRTGPGRRHPNSNVFRRVTVEKGERVVFFMATTQVGGAKEIAYHLPENQRLIRETDVLFVTQKGVEVDV